MKEETYEFTAKEQKAMKQMLQCFAKMQEEGDIDPEANSTLFEIRFNNAMQSLIELMYLCPDTLQDVYDCGY